MKAQDILFLLIFIFLLWRRRPFYSALMGILALVLAVIFFKLSILFTAERLTWYAGALFLYTIIFNFTQRKNEDRN